MQTLTPFEIGQVAGAGSSDIAALVLRAQMAAAPGHTGVAEDQQSIFQRVLADALKAVSARH